MKTYLVAPLVVLLALVCSAAADKPPSLVSSLLDLLPELELLGEGRSEGAPRVSSAEARKTEEAIEVFSLFTPFIREVMQNRAESENEQISENTLKALDTVERVMPKFMNVIVAFASRTKSNPDDEPPLGDFTGLAPRGSYGAPRQSRPRVATTTEGPKIEKEVLKNVLEQSSKIIAQISKATAKKSDSDEAPSVRVQPSRPTKYYISAETTQRPKPRRRRPSSRGSYTTTPAPITYSSEETEAPVRSYTPEPTTQPPTYAPPTPRDDSSEEDTVRTYSTSTRVSSGSQPGSSVSFFSLPTARSSRRQRVTRGSDYQVKPQRYFYVE